MAKPMLVTLPLVLLLLDYWPLRRMTALSAEGNRRSFSIPRRVLIEKIPLLLLTAFSCWITSLVQAGAMQKFEELPMPSRLANAVVAYVAYLGQFFFPTDLAVLYPHPGANLPAWKVLAALLTLAAIFAGALIYRRRIPGLLVGWLWYFGMLVPVLGLIQVGYHAIADRYTYLPQIGLGIAVAWGVQYAVSSWPNRRWVCSIASAIIIAAFMGCAWHQTTFWHDSKTLWTRALACTSANDVAHVNLGATLMKDGKNEEAIAHYQTALAIRPNSVDAHVNLATALTRLGKLNEAAEHYQIALQLQPNNADAHTNFGALLAAVGHVPEAIEHYQKALAINPDHVETEYNLGVALARQGQLNAAMTHYRNALALAPDCVEAHANLGSALESQGQIGDAMTHFRAALPLAERQNKRALADALRARIQRYEATAFPQ
jgi:tetratricopeptide (TPR) repeat protein